MQKILLVTCLFLDSILYSMSTVMKEKDFSELRKKFGESIPVTKTIFYAAEHNNFELAQYCIQNNISDVNDVQRDDKFRTPLMMACKNLNLRLIKLFLNNGAHFHYVDSSGCNALYYTLWHMEPSDNGSDSEGDENSEDDEKKEASEKLLKKPRLDCEIKNVFKKILKIFLNKGIDINCVDNDGNTLLIHAVKSDLHCDFIKILIEFGANTILKNKALKRAADYTENKDVLSILNQCNRKSNCLIL